MIRDSCNFLIWLFWIASFHAPHFLGAQSLTYKIIWKKDSVGYLKVNKVGIDDITSYLILSKVGFRFFGKRTITYEYRSDYDSAGILLNANTKYSRDGKLRETIIVQKSVNSYEVIKDGKKRDNLDYAVFSLSISKMYHNEPFDQSYLLSERWGKVVDIVSIEPHKYKVVKPDGRSNYYSYRNGICQEVIVDNFFATFYFRRVE